MAVTHTKVSAVADGADTSLVRPSDWNAAHAGTNTHTHTDGTSGGSTLAPVATHIADAAAHHAASVAGPDANVTVDTAAAAGTANTYARSQHGHRVNTYASVATDVATTATTGTSGAAPARGDHVHEGLHSIAKSGSTALVGDVTLAQGANVTLTQTGQQITVAATGGGGGLTTAEVAIPAPALTPSAANGAEPIEVSTAGVITVWGMPFPGGLDSHAEIGIPMPAYWDGGAIDAYMHWAANATATSILAKDYFQRSATATWGNADVGGTYAYVGGASSFNVLGTEGTATHTASQSRHAELPASMGFLDGQIYLEHRWDKLITGTNGYVEAGVEFRTQDVTNNIRYRVFLRRRTDATVAIYIFRRTPTQTQIGVFETAITHTANLMIALRVEVEGTSPTNIRARAWVVGGSEPGSWDIEVQDSTASLQVAGGVAIRSYSDTTVTNYSHLVTYDNFLATTTGTDTTMKWAVSGTCFGDGDDINSAAFGTAGTVTDDATTDEWLITNAATFTPGGTPAGGKWLQLRISRLGTDAADLLSATALLRGIRLLFDRT